MTLFKLVLLGAFLVSAAVVVFAFLAGERARQTAPPGSPRPLGSIGEGLRLAARQGPTARVLVLILEQDPISLVLDAAWKDDAPLLARLGQPHTHLVVLRGETGDEVLDHLYDKYVREARSPGASALILDSQGELLTHGTPRDPADLLKLLEAGQASPRLGDA